MRPAAMRLGPAALQLGLTCLHQLDPVRAALPVAQELAASTGYAVALAVWGNFGPTIIRMIDARDPLHVSMRAGTVMSILRHGHWPRLRWRPARRSHREGNGSGVGRSRWPQGAVAQGEGKGLARSCGRASRTRGRARRGQAHPRRQCLQRSSFRSRRRTGDRDHRTRASGPLLSGLEFQRCACCSRRGGKISDRLGWRAAASIRQDRSHPSAT